MPTIIEGAVLMIRNWYALEGKIYVDKILLLRESNHFPHQVYKKQYDLEGKVEGGRKLRWHIKLMMQKNSIFDGTNKSKIHKDSKDYLPNEQRTREKSILPLIQVLTLRRHKCVKCRYGLF